MELILIKRKKKEIIDKLAYYLFIMFISIFNILMKDYVEKDMCVFERYNSQRTCAYRCP